MMKKLLSLMTVLCLLFSLSGCGPSAAESEPPALTEITCSNLADEQTRAQAREIMADSGLSEAQIQMLFGHVDQFNSAVDPDFLADGFQTIPILPPPYDPWAMQDHWTARYPDFLGYNCRITAFSLFHPLVTIPEAAGVRDSELGFDLSALETDPSAFPGLIHSFSALYSTIPTEDTKDIEVHLRNLQEDWKARGITFSEDDRIRLISVVFHTDLDGQELFIGHTGILFPVAEDELYLLEKVAFQEPYQWIRFKSRTELSDYFMTKYDVSEGQPLAPPFILENDQLMEGYRPLPES